ncbi:MAG TPA: hypothetical protein VG456_10465, partial [Candidatus Sulfopaludibacter sp.]|nr:hypothetical protein [Candidatus Sulfopaludibacter sp.]
MISIRKNVNELDRCHEVRDLALDCYVNAIRNAAQYAVELDSQITTPHRQYLNNLAVEVATGDPHVLTESRATVRGLLRDYRDKGAEFLSKLRDELSGTVRALQEIMESMTQGDGDHEMQLRAGLATLRTVSRSAPDPTLREAISSAAAGIEQSIEQIRKHHQVTVSQFLT